MLTFGIGTGTLNEASPRSSIMFLMRTDRSATSLSVCGELLVRRSKVGRRKLRRKGVMVGWKTHQRGWKLRHCFEG